MGLGLDQRTGRKHERARWSQSREGLECCAESALASMPPGVRLREPCPAPVAGHAGLWARVLFPCMIKGDLPFWHLRSALPISPDGRLIPAPSLSCGPRSSGELHPGCCECRGMWVVV